MSTVSWNAKLMAFVNLPLSVNTSSTALASVSINHQKHLPKRSLGKWLGAPHAMKYYSKKAANGMISQRLLLESQFFVRGVLKPSGQKTPNNSFKADALRARP